jgi:hypothetical protein
MPLIISLALCLIVRLNHTADSIALVIIDRVLCGVAFVYFGELADVFKDEREVVFMIALFIPLLSILGVSLVRLNPVPTSKLNKHVLFGGSALALFEAHQFATIVKTHQLRASHDRQK